MTINFRFDWTKRKIEKNPKRIDTHRHDVGEKRKKWYFLIIDYVNKDQENAY